MVELELENGYCNSISLLSAGKCFSCVWTTFTFGIGWVDTTRSSKTAYYLKLGTIIINLGILVLYSSSIVDEASLVPEYPLMEYIQSDWHQPMRPLLLTIPERSSRSLMLDQDQYLVLIYHVPGCATPTLVVHCGRVLVGVHCPYKAL